LYKQRKCIQKVPNRSGKDTAVRVKRRTIAGKLSTYQQHLNQFQVTDEWKNLLEKTTSNHPKVKSATLDEIRQGNSDTKGL
jgi:hypothetical protein